MKAAHRPRPSRTSPNRVFGSARGGAAEACAPDEQQPSKLTVTGLPLFVEAGICNGVRARALLPAQWGSLVGDAPNACREGKAGTEPSLTPSRSASRSTVTTPITAEAVVWAPFGRDQLAAAEGDHRGLSHEASVRVHSLPDRVPGAPAGRRSVLAPSRIVVVAIGLEPGHLCPVLVKRARDEGLDLGRLLVGAVIQERPLLGIRHRSESEKDRKSVV